MADWAKIALKTALVGTIMVGIFAVFANVQVPAIDFSFITVYGGKGLAIAYHYLPIMTLVFPASVVLLTALVGVLAFKYAMIAVKWLFKVNE